MTKQTIYGDLNRSWRISIRKYQDGFNVTVKIRVKNINFYQFAEVQTSTFTYFPSSVTISNDPKFIQTEVVSSNTAVYSNFLQVEPITTTIDNPEIIVKFFIKDKTRDEIENMIVPDLIHAMLPFRG
jgi:hypothetical protein